MKIRLKIKHLVGLVVVAALIVILFTEYVIPRMELTAAEKGLEQGQVTEKEKLLQLIHNAKGSKKWELISEHVIHGTPGLDEQDYDVVVGPGTTQRSGSDHEQRANLNNEEKIPLLLDYIRNGPADRNEYGAAASALARTYYMKGRSDEAVAILKQAEERIPELYGFTRLNLAVQRAELLDHIGERIQGQEIITGLLKDQNNIGSLDLKARLTTLRARFLVREDQVQQAAHLVDHTISLLNSKSRSTPDGAGIDSNVWDPIGRLTELSQKLKAASRQTNPASTVKGRVTRSDGTPLAGVGVFLREKKDVTHSLLDAEPYQTLTNPNGEYEFPAVLAGSYQLYAGFSFDQIDGWTWPVMMEERINLSEGRRLVNDITLRPLLDLISPVNKQVIRGKAIDFEWEPVQGAASYSLYMGVGDEGGVPGIPIRLGIQGTHTQIPVTELYNMQTGIYYYSNSENVMIPDPLTILGFSNSDATYSWSIEAYDAGGKLLTRSNGYRLNSSTLGALPLLQIKSRPLTDADRLLLAGKLDEALAAYKQSIRLNPSDVHSLMMVVRVLDALDNGRADRQKLAEAKFPYLKQLAELYPSADNWFRVVDYYYRHKDWESFHTAYKEMKKYKDAGSDDSYDRSLYATVLLKQGKLEEAAKTFELVMQDDPSHRFLGNYLAAALLRGDSFEAVQALARKYPEDFFAGGEKNWEELVIKLRKEAQGSADYRQELDEKIRWVLSGDKKLDLWLKNTREPSMKRFVQNLAKVG
ncbi:carboxypeptidase regulatory-like domain-containing protein [Paenibacillus sp. YPG26]|uniref:carboxypeptidase regulatory-like domain-containing protein n=1 Tax=Paenibacillus sp. YPG26 TaxID=2878915 RepID=UPI00204118E5|nr:carboxypeptidase regulatory-like domain-containing protein [Paenibacillus sp. YPG26]USB34067.1 carboxypeptidase regulatory-like domain-containing protein [Paenibacillus sp. YPG26]